MKKQPPPTKQYLLESIGKLSGQIGSLSERDERLRKQFSKVLCAPRENAFTSYATVTTYSWEEIFCELGKLLQCKEDFAFRVAQSSHDKNPSDTLIP